MEFSAIQVGILPNLLTSNEKAFQEAAKPLKTGIQRILIFKKQSGRVVENKGSAEKTKRKQSENKAV